MSDCLNAVELSVARAIRFVEGCWKLSAQGTRSVSLPFAAILITPVTVCRPGGRGSDDPDLDAGRFADAEHEPVRRDLEAERLGIDVADDADRQLQTP